MLCLLTRNTLKSKYKHVLTVILCWGVQGCQQCACADGLICPLQQTGPARVAGVHVTPPSAEECSTTLCYPARTTTTYSVHYYITADIFYCLYSKSYIFHGNHILADHSREWFKTQALRMFFKIRRNFNVPDSTISGVFKSIIIAHCAACRNYYR